RDPYGERPRSSPRVFDSAWPHGRARTGRAGLGRGRTSRSSPWRCSWDARTHIRTCRAKCLGCDPAWASQASHEAGCMNALVDRHHGDLFFSLQLLLEGRLRHSVYTPVGMEWWDESYWRFGQVYGDARLAEQFLRVDANWKEIEWGIFLTHD